MRIIIGIIIGIFIIFNWGSIKEYFDEKLSKSEESASSDAKTSQPAAPKSSPQKGGEKVDSFKDFK
jgi:predicted negative regulator of RcsB-dependent stress response